MKILFGIGFMLFEIGLAYIYAKYKINKENRMKDK